MLVAPIDAAESLPGWPHIRGADLDGVAIEMGLVDSFPASGPPVLWVKELGQGYGSLVAQKNRVYTQYQTLAGQFVLCMNAETGETIWSYRYDWPFQAAGQYPGPFSTPTLADDHVYFTTPAGGVSCLTLDGKLVWSRDLKQEFGGMGTDFGYACSPTVVDGKVVLPVGGRGASVVALDAATGDLAWRSGDEAASYVGVLPIKLGREIQVVAYLQNCLVGYDLQTGTQRWKQRLSNGYDEHSCWPLYREPLLWASAPFQAGATLWKLTQSTSLETGVTEVSIDEQSFSPSMSNDVSSSVLVDGVVYGFDLHEAQSKAHRPSRGCFRAIDFESGDVLWSNGDSQTRRVTDFETNADQQIVGHASVLAADGKLFLLNDLGDLILVEANSQRYVELGRVRVLGGEISWASLALDDGRLFLRNRSRAVCLWVGSESRTESSPLQIRDLPQGKIWDFSALIGIEPKYAMDPPTIRWLWNWYLAGSLILLASSLVAYLPLMELSGRFVSTGHSVRFPIVAFLLGILVGPIASVLCKDFVFTWPVCLFIVFVVSVQTSDLRRKSRKRTSQAQFVKSAFVVVAFLLTCSVYFLLCRRLSLVTELSFLAGFPAAVPFLLMDRIRTPSRDAHSIRLRSKVMEAVLMQLAFAAYFGFVVMVLMWYYELPPQ